MAETTKELKKKIASLTKEVEKLTEANHNLNEKMLELYTLYNVSKTLSLSLQLDELFDISMRIIGETLNVSDYNLMLLDETTQTLYMQAMHGQSDDRVRKSLLGSGEGLPGKVLKDVKTVAIKDLSKYKGYVYYSGEKQKKGSYLGIPLKKPDGAPIGVLNAHKPKAVGFSEQEQRMFEAVAEHVAIAIENARAYQRTKELSNRDDLTGLYNRRYFFDRYEKEVERAKRYNRIFSLILMDLDHFKIYNDTNGHLAGDRALRAVADALKDNVRKVDILARYGGEEFVVILPETDKESAALVAEKLRASVEKLRLGADATHGPLTMTLGVSSFPLDSTDAIELLEMADKALYYGKAKGRNRVSTRVLEERPNI